MTGPSDSGRSVALVVAVAKNRIIGKSGTMPWRMPGDLKTFRRLTMGHPIIMGRKTFQSIGKALDGRTNIVVTRDEAFAAEGTLRAGSFDAALDKAKAAASGNEHIMVIGGGEIYRLALAHADTIYMTEINAEPEGDTYFPALPPGEWSEIARETIVADPRDEYAAELITYRRI